MRYGSVCSGIEAASVAWHPLGWTAAWLAEIEKFPSAVLQHHYPDVPNLGDMTRIVSYLKAGMLEAPDVLVGGTPCQAFSVAGLRNSMEDDRGQLTLTYIHILDAIDAARRATGQRPAIALWENVPGILNTHDNAFGCFIAGLAGFDEALKSSNGKWAGSGVVRGPERTVAWRTLDAQHFGLAQRRRRVFVVASAGEVCPSSILFESEGVRRDTPPSREAGQGVTTGAGVGFTPSSFTQYGDVAGSLTARHDSSPCADRGQNVICFEPGIAKREGNVGRFVDECCSTLRKDMGDNQPAVAFGIRTAQTSSNGWGVQEEMTHTLDQAQGIAVAFDCSSLGGGWAPQNVNPSIDVCTTMNCTNQKAVASRMQVRRLTPVECERLQGFPDGWTNIKPNCPDGPRYKALGNSMAVPVMRWIGGRIDEAIRG